MCNISSHRDLHIMVPSPMDIRERLDKLRRNKFNTVLEGQNGRAMRTEASGRPTWCFTLEGDAVNIEDAFIPIIAFLY